MIKVFLERHEGEEISCPYLCCDHCGKKVEDLGMAMYVWDYTSDDPKIHCEKEKKEGTEIFVVHKGRCDVALGKMPLSQESDTLLPRLVNNHADKEVLAVD